MITNRRPLDVRDYLNILRRRKWVIVFPTLLVGVATFFITKAVPDLYRSETLILIEEQKVPEAFVRPTVQTDLAVRMQTLKQQIFSRTRLQAIIEKFGLLQSGRTGSLDKLVDRLRNKDIEIELVPRRDRRGVAGFKIYFAASSPPLAQAVLREITGLFMEENLRARAQQAAGTTQFLEVQLGRARQRLQEQEQRLRKFKMRYFGELPQEQQTNLTLLGQSHIELQANSSTLDRQQQEKTYLESLLSAQAVIQESGGRVLGLSAPDTPARRLEVLQTRLLELEAKYTPDHPDLISTQAEIDRLKHARAEAAEEKGEGTDDPLKDKVPAAQSAEAIRTRSRLQALEVAVQQTLQERTEIQERIRTLQRRVTVTPLREQQLTELTRDYEVAQRQYDSLLQKRHESQMAADLESRQRGEQFRILDPPNLPTAPYKSPRLRLNLLGVGGGLFLALAMVVGLEFTNDSLRTERDVSYYINLPTLASVPRVRIPRRKRRRDEGGLGKKADFGRVRK